MGKIHVAFHDGFDGQMVRLMIDSREVFSQELKTRYQIGYAASYEVTVANGKHELIVQIDDTKSTMNVEVSDGTLYIGVSRESDGRLQMRSTTEPFRYL